MEKIRKCVVGCSCSLSREKPPLATMGKGEAAAANAGLEAVRILAVEDRDLGSAYEDYVAQMAREVEEKDARLLELGATVYLQ